MDLCEIKPLESVYSDKLDNIFGVKSGFLEINPCKFIMPSYHKNFVKLIFDTTIREDDIWLVSYPRTGSTWCQEMIWLLSNNLDFETAQNTIQHIRAPLFESSTILKIYEFVPQLAPIIKNSIKYVNEMPSPRYVKTHLPLQLLPTQISKIKPKIIYTCRNPKDMSVSYYFYLKMFHGLNIEFEEFCDLMLIDKMPPGSVFDHCLPFWYKRHEKNILFLKYEDMITDLKTTLHKIAKFLGKSYTDEGYDSLCDFLSLHNMQANKGCNCQFVVDSVHGQNYNSKEGQKFIRKGVVGDWKNYMSPELSKRFNDWMKKNLDGTGLSFD